MKNPDVGHLDTGTMAGSKLTRFKQSLTTGLQQVNDSGKKGNLFYHFLKPLACGHIVVLSFGKLVSA